MPPRQSEPRMNPLVTAVYLLSAVFAAFFAAHLDDVGPLVNHYVHTAQFLLGQPEGDIDLQTFLLLLNPQFSMLVGLYEVVRPALEAAANQIGTGTQYLIDANAGYYY